MEIDSKKILDEVIARNASDLHLVQGYRPTLRVNGSLIPLLLYPALTPKNIQNIFLSYTTQEQQNIFFLNKELDFGLTYTNLRFRINAYQEKDSVALSLRTIPNKIPSIDDLFLPTSLHNLSNEQFGLAIISGQTGEGKSTTLAAVINEINLHRKAHIITIEDPIEFIYPIGQSIISQREVKKDTLSFNKALKSVLREDPDVIVLGEMRDYETISLALTLAETGHLVFSTLHTNTASQTIDRIVDVFPEEQQNQIKSQLANVLRGIVCQKLLPRSDIEGRIVGYEVLYNNTAISSLIREGKTYQIDNILQTSSEENMILFENSLKTLVSSGYIRPDTAIKYALRPRLMQDLLS